MKEIKTGVDELPKVSTMQKSFFQRQLNRSVQRTIELSLVKISNNFYLVGGVQYKETHWAHRDILTGIERFHWHDAGNDLTKEDHSSDFEGKIRLILVDSAGYFGWNFSGLRNDINVFRNLILQIISRKHCWSLLKKMVNEAYFSGNNTEFYFTYIRKQYVSFVWSQRLWK